MKVLAIQLKLNTKFQLISISSFLLIVGTERMAFCLPRSTLVYAYLDLKFTRIFNVPTADFSSQSGGIPFLLFVNKLVRT